MENTRLMILEGLPGTGKTTNAYLLYRQLTRAGRPVRWIHEVARPHPCVPFYEACLSREAYAAYVRDYPHAGPLLAPACEQRHDTVGIDLLEAEWHLRDALGPEAFAALQAVGGVMLPPEAYKAACLDKWAYFVAQALAGEDTVYILDSSLFQCQIFTLLWNNTPYAQIEAFVGQLLDIAKPLRPSLVYLYRDRAQDTVDFLERLRGTKSLEGLWTRDRARPYYRDKPEGAAGARQFLLDYADMAGRLFAAADCRKLGIEIGAQDWPAHEREMLAFLGVARRALPEGAAPDGVYRSEALGEAMVIAGGVMTDPEGTRRALHPIGDGLFHAENLPTVLRFAGPDRVEVVGGQIVARWTTAGEVFVRG